MIIFALTPKHDDIYEIPKLWKSQAESFEAWPLECNVPEENIFLYFYIDLKECIDSNILFVIGLFVVGIVSYKSI